MTLTRESAELSGSTTNCNFQKQERLLTCSTILMHFTLHGTSWLLQMFHIFQPSHVCGLPLTMHNTPEFRPFSSKENLCVDPTWYQLKNPTSLHADKHVSITSLPGYWPNPTSHIPLYLVSPLKRHFSLSNSPLHLPREWPSFATIWGL